MEHDADSSPIVATRRRALVAFTAASLGLFAARFGPMLPSWGWLAAALLIAGVAGFLRGVWLRAALAVAMSLLAGSWFTMRVLERPADSFAAMFEPDTPTVVTLHGVVTGVPTPITRPAVGLARFAPPMARWRLEFDATQLEIEKGPVPATGRVWVRVAGEAPPSVRVGDAARITGTLTILGPPGNPGEEDIRLLAAQRGFVGTLALTTRELIEPIAAEAGPSSRARAWLLRSHEALRAWASNAVDACLVDADDRTRFLVRGLILGDFDPTQRDLRDAFARQGLVHVLTISGFHLAVMAAFALFAVRLTGDRGWVEPMVVGVLVLAYAAVVPASSPILRSATMVLALLLAEACGRRYDRVTVLLWIGVGLLAWRPLDLWNLGFQLSLGLTGALLWLGERFGRVVWREEVRGLVAPREPSAWRACKRWVKQSAYAALLCWLVGTPVLMHAVGMVSPLAALATMAVTPIIVLMLWVGYAGVVIVGVFPQADGLVAAVLSWLARGASGAVAWFDALPGSVIRVPPVSGWWALAATVGIVALVRWGTRRHAWCWALPAVLLGWLGVEWSLAGRLPAGVVVRIDMFDVGDGSCYLVRSGREAMLWDAGGQGRGGMMHPTVASCRTLGVSRVSTLAITHPDVDHFGAVEGLLGPLHVRRVIAPERFIEQARVNETTASTATKAVFAAGAEIVVAQEGDEAVFGDVRLVVQSPPPNAAWSLDNDHSLVVLLECPTDAGPRIVLLTGDIQDAGIEHLRRRGAGHVDVIEAPHHGSAKPAAIHWLADLRPGVVLQSTGRARRGDPRWAGVREACVWLSTAERGWAWVEVRRDGSVRYGTMH